MEVSGYTTVGGDILNDTLINLLLLLYDICLHIDLILTFFQQIISLLRYNINQNILIIHNYDDSSTIFIIGVEIILLLCLPFGRRGW